VQPVVTLTVNGSDRADVAAGRPVDLVGQIDVPPGAGVVVSAAWDVDGTGTYDDIVRFADRAATQQVTRSQTFDEPGTYFVTLRATAQRDVAVGSPYGQAANLARVRVVVT
jgi:hypothetical protein